MTVIDKDDVCSECGTALVSSQLVVLPSIDHTS